MTPKLSTSAVARSAGVGVETIRFYERQGLLEPPRRRASGYRQYDQTAVEVLRFIRRAKQLGFTLKEIKGLLALRLDTTATRTQIRNEAKAKVADIEDRIADLQKMRDALTQLIEKCHGNGTIQGCPILGALQGIEE